MVRSKWEWFTNIYGMHASVQTACLLDWVQIPRTQWQSDLWVTVPTDWGMNHILWETPENLKVLLLSLQGPPCAPAYVDLLQQAVTLVKIAGFLVKVAKLRQQNPQWFHIRTFFQQALQLGIPKEKTDGAPYWVIVQLTQWKQKMLAEQTRCLQSQYLWRHHSI